MKTICMHCIGPGCPESFHSDSRWSKLFFLSTWENTEHMNSSEKLKDHFRVIQVAEFYQNQQHIIILRYTSI